MARPPRVQLNLKVPPQLREQLTAAARDAGVSTNRFCEFGLAIYLQFLSTENPPPVGNRQPTVP